MARKKSSLGCLFYTALVLLVIVLFLFQWKTVREVVEKTGFLKYVQKEAGEEPPAPVPRSGPAAGGGPAAAPEQEPGPGSAAPAPRTSPAAPAPGPSAQAPSAKTPSARTPSAEKAAPKAPPPAARASPAGSAPAHARAAPRKPESRVRKARIFFVSANAEGEIAMKGVVRSVEYVDAPLRSTLETLLKGPSPEEIQQGLITAIPRDTRLNNITLQDDTAVLDFSESFRFNSLGEEGLEAQLKQVVYSTTEFPTLRRVQILIDGKRLKYLGPEGAYIGEPLSRSSFRQ
jgi:spore germination protein GerM